MEVGNGRARRRFRTNLVNGLAALAALSCAASAATTINVDFNASEPGSAGTFSGPAAAPDSGITWNGLTVGAKGNPAVVPGLTSGPLLTSTGLSTPVTVTLGNFKTYDAFTDGRPATAAPALLSDFVYQETLGPGGPNSTFSINNLSAGFTYDLYLYAQNGGYASTATIFTINGSSKIATNAGDIPTLIADTNYVVFRGLVPNSGTISGVFNDIKPADNAAFNGLQIVQIPEPTGLSLLAFGGMLALRRRRCP